MALFEISIFCLQSDSKVKGTSNWKMLNISQIIIFQGGQPEASILFSAYLFILCIHPNTYSIDIDASSLLRSHKLLPLRHPLAQTTQSISNVSKHI